MRSRLRGVVAHGFVLLALLGCDTQKDAVPVSAATASATAAPSAPPPAPEPPDPNGCVGETDPLVPLTSYEHTDFIRAVVTDGDRVYYRTYEELRSVPLAGGASTLIASTPGGLLTAPLWLTDERVVSQTPGQSVFIAAPKAGGPFATILDASHDARTTSAVGAKVEDPKTRTRTLPAAFDGKSFYFIEQTGVFPVVESSVIRKLPLAGGSAAELYRWHGVLEGLVLAGDRLFFFQREPPKVAPVAGRPQVGTTEATVFSLATSGGKAVPRAPGLKGEPLLGNDQGAYFTGFANGDVEKPGIFRLTSAGTAGPEQVDWRHLAGGIGLPWGDRVVLLGTAYVVPPAPGTRIALSPVALVGPKRGGKLERAFCLTRGYDVKAAALSGNTALLSVVRQRDHHAGILRVTLP